jgi:hypothetical protein
MVHKECNLRAGVYKVQTFGTTQVRNLGEILEYKHLHTCSQQEKGRYKEPDLGCSDEYLLQASLICYLLYLYPCGLSSHIECTEESAP